VDKPPAFRIIFRAEPVLLSEVLFISWVKGYTSSQDTFHRPGVIGLNIQQGQNNPNSVGRASKIEFMPRRCGIVE
jgi:hypothetical protein